jgi:hypothetical protein
LFHVGVVAAGAGGFGASWLVFLVCRSALPVLWFRCALGLVPRGLAAAGVVVSARSGSCSSLAWLLPVLHVMPRGARRWRPEADDTGFDLDLDLWVWGVRGACLCCHWWSRS